MVPAPTSPDNDSAPRTNPVADAIEQAKNHFATRGTVATLNEISTRITRAYLAAIDPADPPSPGVLEAQLLGTINAVRKIENAKTKGSEKIPTARTLTPREIAQVLHRLHIIKEVVPGGMSGKSSVGMLSIYQHTGRDRGTYRPAEHRGSSGSTNGGTPGLESLAQSYNPSLDERGFKEVTRLVRLYAERVTETLEPDLIPMENVILDYRTNERIEFSPEYVFLAKFDTALPDERPELPVIPDERCADGSWDVESWTEEVHPAQGMADYMWKIRCAMLRNRVNWKKAFLFYDPRGSTGKGTENELIRGLIGADNCTSVPLADFGKEFGTEPLVGALANIVDELPVGSYYRDLSDFKATVTHDRITINRKHEKALSYRPNLGSLFNLNEHIDASDKTGSLLRRFTLIPFTKRFLGATDNSAIKEDYVQRREVREYIAYKVLVDMPKFWDLASDEPALVRQTLDAYRLETQSVAAWADECLEQFEGDMVAFGQAHAHYYAWTKERSPASKPLPQPEFTSEIKQLLDPDVWIVPTVTGEDNRVTDKLIYIRTWITKPEPLLDEFEYDSTVRKWQPEALVHGGVPGRLPKSAPRLARGFVRRDLWEEYEATGERPSGDPSDSPPQAQPEISPWPVTPGAAGGITYMG